MIRKVILLVEDNADDEALTLRALTRNNIGNEVDRRARRRGGARLAVLHRAHTSRAIRAQQPALVLLDLKLPKVDGLEVLRRIREHAETRLVPVVILTSSREEQDRLHGYLERRELVHPQADRLCPFRGSRASGRPVLAGAQRAAAWHRA